MNISVIIPTLNEEKLLPGLLSQLNDYARVNGTEIILSDGRSSDSTVKNALGLVDKIIVFSGKGFQNIASGRNDGAEAAAGDLLIFFNGDVRLKNPEYFFKKVEKIFTEPDVLAMSCYVRVFPEEETFCDKIFLSFYNRYFKILNDVGVGMGRGECQVVRKKTFDEMGGYNSRLAAGEDFDLFTRIRKKGKVVFESSLVVYESPRRYRKYGHFRILFSWLINSVYVYFFKKSASETWKEVR